MKRWFVVQVRAGQERSVSRAIESDDVDVFLPTFKREIAIGRKREDVVRPLFPLYTFAAFDLGAPAWAEILRTPNVATILGIRARQENRNLIPLPVPDFVITRLKQLALLGGGHIVIDDDRPPPLRRLVPGEKVRVMGTEFDGLKGLVDRDHKHRVAILLDFLGKQTRTFIAREQLEPLSLGMSARS